MQFYHGNKPPDVQGSNLHFNILTLKGLPFSGGTIELRKKNSVMVNQNTYGNLKLKQLLCSVIMLY